MMPGKTSARWLLSLIFILFGARASSARIPNERCIECHSQKEILLLSAVFADGDAVSVYINKDAFLQSAHGELACTECHRESHPEFSQDFTPSEASKRRLPSHREYALAMNHECRRCHQTEGDARYKQIHAVLHPRGNEETPVCTDCHLPHEMSRNTRGADMARNCAKCHADTYDRFSASVHGVATGSPPNPDLPTCTTCHFGHVSGGKSPTVAQVRLGRPCMGCHSDAALMRKYGISANVVTTYLQDFHGVSLHFYEGDLSGAKKYPLVCVDCHGYHDVKPLTSSTAVAEMKAGLQQACQKCHENATANFTEAWLSHREPSWTSNVLVFLVKLGYMMLIPFVILGLIVHIAFDVIVQPIRKWRNAKRQGTGGYASAHSAELPPGVPKYFVRFSRIQRAEHLVVMTTFGILLATGLPQRFYEATWATALVNFLGGIDLVRYIHRVAGIIFTLVAVLHFVRVAAGILFRDTPLSMVPTRKDFEDTIGTLKYQLGFSDERPKADRFDYGQKFEYWGMVLGSVVMVASGFVLIYPMALSQFLPGQFIAAARMAHSYEAMMALLTIIVWHMYGARFNPVIFTGKISSRHLAEHHPLEYERLVRNLNQSQGGPASAPTTARQLATRPLPEPAGIANPAPGEASENASTRESLSTARTL